MSVFSIILLSLLGIYIAVWCVDRWLVQPKRDLKTLPEVNRRLDEIEKKLESKKAADGDFVD